MIMVEEVIVKPTAIAIDTFQDIRVQYLQTVFGFAFLPVKSK